MCVCVCVRERERGGVGVYQGDPLSVAIFNTVINTLVDTLDTRLDLGFHISDSRHIVNLLQYADDTCIVVNGPTSAQYQYILDIVDRWLLWSGMKVKVSKCSSRAIQGCCLAFISLYLNKNFLLKISP